MLGGQGLAVVTPNSFVLPFLRFSPSSSSSQNVSYHAYELKIHELFGLCCFYQQFLAATEPLQAFVWNNRVDPGNGLGTQRNPESAPRGRTLT